IGISEEPESGPGPDHDLRRCTRGSLLSGPRRESDGQLHQEESCDVLLRLGTKTRGEMIYSSAGFQSLHFSKPPAMGFFPRKRRMYERADQLARQFRTDHSRAQRQNIHIIVLHSLTRRIGVVTHSRADARHFVGGHRGADAAAANKDAALGPPFLNG